MISRLAQLCIVAGTLLSPAWARYAVQSVFDSDRAWDGDGKPANNVFLVPRDIAVDTAGNLYVIHNYNRSPVIKIGIDGIAHQIIGGGKFLAADGMRATDAFISGRGIVVDAAGEVYISDTNRYTVYKIGSDGLIKTVAGNGTRGFSGDGGPGAQAQLTNPQSLALDGAGNLYILDNYRVRQVAPGGTIRTVAGNGTSGTTVDGAAATATSINANFIAVEPSGTLVLAPLRGSALFRVGTDGIIRKFAGGAPTFNYNDNPIGTQVTFNDLYGVAVGANGNTYISEYGGRLRRIAPSSAVTTIAGTRSTFRISGDGGPAVNATISKIGRVCADANDTVWFIDSLTVRRIKNGKIETVAGSHAANVLSPGTFAETQTMQIAALTRDSAGNFYVADQLSHSIYRAPPDLSRLDRIAGTGSPGRGILSGSALDVPLSVPTDVAVDNANNVYISDQNTVRKLTPAGQIQIIAGADDGDFFTENADPLKTYLYPHALALSRSGELYIASDDEVVRLGPDGRLHLVYKRIDTEYSSGLDVDANGNVYLTDGNYLRKVTASGTASILAGTGTAGFSGDGGLATAAKLNRPLAVSVDKDGNILFLDTANARLRRVTKAGIIETIGGAPAGTGYGNQWESTTVFLQLNNALFFNNAALFADPSGTIWLADFVRTIRLDTAQIFSNWVVNAASFALGSIAPGEVVTIFGDAIGPDTLVSATYQNNILARQVGQTRVLFNEIEAPLVYVSKTQTSVLVPYGVSGTATMVVEYQGIRTNTIQMPVGAAMPGIFTYAGGSGQIVAVNQDYALNGATAKAAPGDYVVVFLTGQGTVTPAVGDGILPTGPNYPAASLQILVAGISVPVADIWNGLIYQGVLQVNFKLPANTPSGNQTVEITVGGVASQGGATIAVR